MHHATLTVSDAAGRSGTAKATVTITVPKVAVLALSGLTISPSTLHAAANGASITKVKLRTGATISYTDSQAATTTLTIQRRVGGIRRGKSCVAMPRHPGRHFKRCKRMLTVGTFSHLDAAGRNRLHFTGRVGGRKLPPGRYTLRAVARNRSRKSSGAVAVAFVTSR